MKFRIFLEEKISFFLFQISFIFFISILLLITDYPLGFIAFINLFFLIYTLGYLLFSFYKRKIAYEKIIHLVDELEEKYLIAEVLLPPKRLENKAYYYALKKSCKSMNDKISILEQEQLDYQEYVESFAHEIKTPISILSLALDNLNNIELKEEVKKIEEKVEQMLYYARSENTEKDYFVKKLKLSEVLHPIILEYKNNLLKSKISLQISSLDYYIYTDEKWLTFIVSQVFQNAIKYLDKKEKRIEIEAWERKNQIVLSIKDNGSGISNADIGRVFEKGFTGTNRKKEHSTGMGLYLAKKLCVRLNLEIKINSQKGNYTKVEIIFPKSSIHNREYED